jgi:hypothetical protein
MANSHALRFSRLAIFTRPVGDDGLTARQRRQRAKRYLATAGRMRSKQDMDALELRMKAERDAAQADQTET